MIRGETVTVRIPTETGEIDPSGRRLTAYTDEQVDDVLVEPADWSNATDGTRPDGIQATTTFHFPRTWKRKRLKGAQLVASGRTYDVIGDPAPVDGGLTPTRWNLSVKATATEG